MVTWVSPTGHNDPNADWTDDTNAYDDDTGTYAYASVTGSPLELTHAAVLCDRVRFLTCDLTTFDYTCQGGLSADVDVYYDGAWHNIFSGTLANNAWEEILIGSTVEITGVRITPTSINYDQAVVHEADFGEAPPGPGQMLDPTSKTW